MSNEYFEELSKRLVKFAMDRDWDQFHAPKNLVMALSVEAAELTEHFQWLTEEQSHNLSKEKLDEVALEMADIYIYLTRLATKLEVDLPQYVDDKIKINEKKYPVEKVKGSAKKYDQYK
ncbi:MAG: nucleotide pyrophosphohydrolase [Gammaproteobacteria bacterium]|nr:nucleotide pyrophosphohydrolase [Gammaproteobacteria bacterium]